MGVWPFRFRLFGIRYVPLAAAAACTWAASTLPAVTAGDPRQVTLECAVFYTPARQIWKREVVIGTDSHGALSLRIDGVPPYRFFRHGTVVNTALDNERIRIDLARGWWQSDLRGLAAGEGPCTARR